MIHARYGEAHVLKALLAKVGQQNLQVVADAMAEAQGMDVRVLLYASGQVRQLLVTFSITASGHRLFIFRAMRTNSGTWRIVRLAPAMPDSLPLTL